MKLVCLYLGPFNLSGQWSGVMGNVILGNFDFSPSLWIFLPERQPLLDYATVMNSKLVLCLNPPPLLIEDEGILLGNNHLLF